MNDFLNKNSFKTLVFLVLAFLSKTLWAASVSGISISPTRVYLNENKKSASISLTNSSDNVVSYRLKFVEMGISNNGQLINLQENEFPTGFRSAASHIRFSPRQVRLDPGQSQVIRLITRRGAATPSGEYRSHLEIRALPEVRDSNTIAFDPEATPVIGAAIVSRLGVTLPVILNVGEQAASVDVKNLKLLSFNKKIRQIEFDLHREGDKSVFGDIRVVWVQSGGNKDEILLGELSQYGLYNPYKKETIKIPTSNLNHPVSKTDGSIKIYFSKYENGEIKGHWYAEEKEWVLVEN